MSDTFLLIDNVRVPRFLYGTAWKEEATQQLVTQALDAGFRGIDTANQRRHYYEAAVGAARQEAIQKGTVRGDDLFLQTKFTFRRGQDHRLPYDPQASIATQVAQSFASSQEHLGTNVIDSYVLHGPSTSSGLTEVDWEAWRAMELLHEQGLVRLLGISNVTAEQLEALVQKARVQPLFVQNRCYASMGWDRQVRQVAAKHGIHYQGFSLLTANQPLIRHPWLSQLAARYGKTPNQVIFRFALDIGMIPLTGTSNAAHMREDLAIFDFQLDPQDVAQIEAAAG